MNALKTLTVMCNHLGYEIIDTLTEERLASCLKDLHDLCTTDGVVTVTTVTTDAMGDAAEAAIDFKTVARDLKADRAQLKKLLSIPTVEQRSERWYQMRQNLLTASDLAQALGKGKFGTRATLLKKKVTNDSSFNAHMAPLKWGTMFEDMVMRCYQQKSANVGVHNFGLLPHPDIECFGASPDGITSLGVMVELKAPYKRKIEMGTVPEQYYYQIQGQLSVCGLSKCDYVEASMATYDSLQEYREKHRDEREFHGIIIEFTRNEMYEYIYSPEGLTAEEAYAWVSKEVETFDDEGDRHLAKLTPWHLVQINIVRVDFDEQKWADVVPHIRAFWKEVSDGRLALASVAPSASKTLDLTDGKDAKDAKDAKASKYKKPKYEFVDDDD